MIVFMFTVSRRGVVYTLNPILEIQKEKPPSPTITLTKISDYKIEIHCHDICIVMCYALQAQLFPLVLMLTEAANPTLSEGRTLYDTPVNVNKIQLLSKRRAQIPLLLND